MLIPAATEDTSEALAEAHRQVQLCLQSCEQEQQDALEWSINTGFQSRVISRLFACAVLTPEMILAKDVLIKLGPAFGTALGAWLHARYGRKIRVKVGDIEAEAQTPEEVAELLDKAQAIRERNEPKRILP